MTHVAGRFRASLRPEANLSDVANPATALANLGALSGATAMLRANNLSDLASASAGRVNLGVATGAYASGNYYATAGALSAGSSGSYTNGQLRLAPWVVPDPLTLTRIAAEVTGAGDAGCTLRLGIYADNAGVPGALILDAGTIPGDAVAVAEITISQALARGLYWVGGAVQGVTVTAPTLKTFTGAAQVPITFGTTLPAAGTVGNSFLLSGVTAALPGSAAGAVVAGSSPRILVKVA